MTNYPLRVGMVLEVSLRMPPELSGQWPCHKDGIDIIAHQAIACPLGKFGPGIVPKLPPPCQGCGGEKFNPPHMPAEQEAILRQHLTLQ